MTAVVAVWGSGTHRLRWITAGHPRPIVLRADGTLETLTAGVVRPLGIEEDLTRMRAAEDRLSPGDRLLLYSTGSSSSRTGAPPSRWGWRRCTRSSAGRPKGAPPSSCVRLQDVVIDASSGRLRDDVSLLALAVDDERAAPSGS